MRRNLNVVGADFDQIKENLKRELKDNAGLTDVDFEGSAAAVMLDILAYNTFYNNVYLNAGVNEAFIGTALQRNNVVAHANPLGYIPKSMSCSRIIGDIRVPHGSPITSNYIIVPKDFIFTTKIENRTYRFQTMEEFLLESDGTAYTNKITLYEGMKYTFRYNVNTSINQTYEIPNEDIDTELVTVGVVRGTKYTEYTKKVDLANIDAKSKVYWMRENDAGLYEVEFGDGTFGEGLQTGDIIVIDYYISNGAITNGARVFETQGDLDGFSDISFIPDTPAFGGAIREDIESVRDQAPKLFETQNRCVTWNDYEILIRKNFPWIESVSVWGGEDNVPPYFGRAVISAKPITGEYLTTTEENEVTGYLKEYNVSTIKPMFVDPDYIYMKIKSDVRFDYTKSPLSISGIQEKVKRDIFNYIDTTLQSFKSAFHISVLNEVVFNSDDAINSNTATIELMKRVQPILGVQSNYIIDFNNALEIESISSTPIYVSGSGQPIYLESSTDINERVGNRYPIRYFQVVDGVGRTSETIIGSIDYDNGIVQLNNIMITKIPTGLFEVTCRPVAYDIYPERGQILTGRDSDIIVNIIPEVGR